MACSSERRLGPRRLQDGGLEAQPEDAIGTSSHKKKVIAESVHTQLVICICTIRATGDRFKWEEWSVEGEVNS